MLKDKCLHLESWLESVGIISICSDLMGLDYINLQIFFILTQIKAQEEEVSIRAAMFITWLATVTKSQSCVDMIRADTMFM